MIKIALALFLGWVAYALAKELKANRERYKRKDVIKDKLDEKVTKLEDVKIEGVLQDLDEEIEAAEEELKERGLL